VVLTLANEVLQRFQHWSIKFFFVFLLSLTLSKLNIWALFKSMYKLSCKNYVSVTRFFYRNKNINYKKTKDSNTGKWSCAKFQTLANNVLQRFQLLTFEVLH
jgi:hypothetical protein